MGLQVPAAKRVSRVAGLVEGLERCSFGRCDHQAGPPIRPSLVVSTTDLGPK